MGTAVNLLKERSDHVKIPCIFFICDKLEMFMIIVTLFEIFRYYKLIEKLMRC